MSKSRLVTLIVATAGVLGLLASFHTTPGTSPRAAGAAIKGAAPPAATAPPPPTGTSPAPSTPSSTRPAGRRTVDGATVLTDYGDVQVRIVVDSGRIVDVQALQLPSDRSRSVRISNFAGPQLRQEALQAQSARIDTVSGATYTSDGYAQSLQSAIDRAGLKS